MATVTSRAGTNPFFRTWWILLLRGLLAICLGLLVFRRPAFTLAAMVLGFGVYAIVEGVSSLFAAIGGWTHRDDRWLMLLEAIIGIGVGIITLRTPGITAVVLIFFIAIWALATGILRIVEGIRLQREVSGGAWLVVGGVASVLFALLVLMRPLAGILALIGMLGMFGLVLGITEVILAFKVRRGPQVLRPPVSSPSQDRAA